MAKYQLLALTNASAGAEAELNDWYDHRHVPDVLAVPGIVSAQRFKVAAGFEGPLQWRYLTLYELDTESPQAVMQALHQRVGTADMMMTPALDASSAGAVILEALGAKVVRNTGG